MVNDQYSELKLLIFRNGELYFKSGYINKHKLNIGLFQTLWLMMLLAPTLLTVKKQLDA